jgi:hypothetical protein
MGKACSTHGSEAYEVSMGHPEGRRPLVRPRISWGDDIIMYRKAIRWEVVVLDRYQWQDFVNTVMNLLRSVKCWEFE